MSTNVKVFALKFLVAHYFFMCTWIEFIFGRMIDTRLKFLSTVSAPMTVTLRTLVAVYMSCSMRNCTSYAQ